jgi:hypothetical protein
MLYSFKLTEADIEEYAAFRLRYPFIMRNIRPLSIGIVSILAFGGSYLINKDDSGNLLSMWWVMPTIVLGFTLYFIRNINFNTRINDAYKEIIFGERQMKFNDKELFLKDNSGEDTHAWSTFDKWEVSQNLYLLYIKGNAAFIIPKRIFENDNSRTEFENILKFKVFEKRNLSDSKYLDT